MFHLAALVDLGHTIPSLEKNPSTSGASVSTNSGLSDSGKLQRWVVQAFPTVILLESNRSRSLKEKQDRKRSKPSPLLVCRK